MLKLWDAGVPLDTKDSGWLQPDWFGFILWWPCLFDRSLFPSPLLTMELNQERWAKPCSPSSSSSSCCGQGLSGYWAPGPWGRIKSGLLFPVVPELALQRWEQEKPPSVMECLWLRGRQTQRDWVFGDNYCYLSPKLVFGFSFLNNSSISAPVLVHT